MKNILHFFYVYNHFLLIKIRFLLKVVSHMICFFKSEFRYRRLAKASFPCRHDESCIPLNCLSIIFTTAEAFQSCVALTHPDSTDLAVLMGTNLVDDNEDRPDTPTAMICVFADKQVYASFYLHAYDCLVAWDKALLIALELFKNIRTSDGFVQKMVLYYDS